MPGDFTGQVEEYRGINLLMVSIIKHTDAGSKCLHFKLNEFANIQLFSSS